MGIMSEKERICRRENSEEEKSGGLGVFFLSHRKKKKKNSRLRNAFLFRLLKKTFFFFRNHKVEGPKKFSLSREREKSGFCLISLKVFPGVLETRLLYPFPIETNPPTNICSLGPTNPFVLYSAESHREVSSSPKTESGRGRGKQKERSRAW